MIEPPALPTPPPARKLLELLGPFLGLAAVVTLFGALEPSFLTQRNFQTIAVLDHSLSTLGPAEPKPWRSRGASIE